MDRITIHFILVHFWNGERRGRRVCSLGFQVQSSSMSCCSRTTSVHPFSFEPTYFLIMGYRSCKWHVPVLRNGFNDPWFWQKSMFSQGCTQTECMHACYFSRNQRNAIAHSLVKLHVEISVIAETKPQDSWFLRFFSSFPDLERLHTCSNVHKNLSPRKEHGTSGAVITECSSSSLTPLDLFFCV